MVAAWEGDDLTVLFVGEIDFASAAGLSSRLALVLAGHQPRRIVLDLARVRFMDCAGLRPVIRARRALPAGQPLVLRSPTRPVRLLLRVTGLDEVCVIEG